MAFYDKFPYTNFQELNLDWLTQEVSKVRDNRDASDASAAAALASEKAAKASETAAASSQQAAANSETAAAGSEAASAEYLEQIGTHTAGAVADWLKDNITPTTPAVDASLTISGAAADAKKTGDAVNDLKSAFDDALSPSGTLYNLCTGFQKGKSWTAWNNGDTVTLTDNANYMAATVVLGDAQAITLNRMWDNNSFCFYADADNKRIGLLRDYQISGVDYAYTVPTGAVYAYISQNITTEPNMTYIDSEGVVVLNGSTSIRGQATIAEYPYGGQSSTEYHADDLRMASVNNEKLSEILPPVADIPNKVIKSTSTIYSKAGLSDFNDAPDNSLITVLIPASTAPSDLPANYPVNHVIKGLGQLTTYLSSNGEIKIQTYRNAVQGLTYTRYYTANNGWQAWYQINVKKRYTCLKNGNGDFSSLVTAINALSDEMDVELFVGPGTWDIIDEFGETYMNAVSSNNSTWGLVLKNRIHIICSSNSLITAKYTGSNTNVKTYFSAFNAGEYGFTLENANIETDNVRYTIHDDRGSGGGEGYYNRYINCSMKHTNGMYTDCIGGGLGTNGMIEILNCYFEGDANATRLAYYHGNNYSGQTNAQCKIVVKGNYFAGLGTFGLTKYGDSTKVSTAYVSDNSVGSALFVNSGSYAPQANMQIVAWNNEVRS